MDAGKRLIMLLALFVQVVLTAAGLWPAIWLVRAGAGHATAAWHWVLLLLGAGFAFLYGYLLALLLLRILVPYPPEGVHRLRKTGRPPKEMGLFMLNVIVAKARQEPPWMTFIGFTLINLPPLRPLYRRYFGPHTTSDTVADTLRLLDPWLVYAGKNVQFGFGATITCHLFDSRRMYIKRVVIEDDVTIGGEAKIGPGVTIGRGAMIEALAVVVPNTEIGPYEQWAGCPAQFVKKIVPRKPSPPDGQLGPSPPLDNSHSIEGVNP